MSFRFRLGLIAGFGVGYYLGARAGEDRYKQMRQGLDRLRSSEVFGKARAAVDLGIERVKEAADPGEPPLPG